MADGIKWSTEQLDKGIFAFDVKADKAVRMFAETQAKVLEKDMKENRPWTDRTGDARKRLTCKVESTKRAYVLVLAHGVDYGIWLELANEGKYNIIQRTVDLESAYIMRDFEGLLNKMGY